MKLLFTTLTSNDLGLLTRSLPIAAELAKRGHQVAFCNPALAPSRLVAEAGFDNLMLKHPLFYLQMTGTLSGLFEQFRTAPIKQAFGGPLAILIQLLRAMPTRLPPITPDVWNIDHFAEMIGMANERYTRASCDAFVRLMTEYSPDAVVDFWNPFACMAARAVRIPLVTVIQADLHPASQGFIWWKGPPPPRLRPVSVVNRIRAHYHLAPVIRIADLLVGDTTLVLGIPETDPLPEGSGAIHVGPILWQKPGARMPDWFDTLRPEKPVIWVYSGNPRYMPVRTPTDSTIVLHACIAALADRDVQVVLTTGHHNLPKSVLPLPANFVYTPFVPGLAMAERSDMLIHHGGYGSCQTGLFTGTPAVILPTYAERESNARRIAAVGAGEFIVPTSGTWGRKHIPVDELGSKIDKVLHDPTYTARARRISAKMQAVGGATAAASLIEAAAT